LTTAEKFSTLAALTAGCEFPAATLRQAWRDVLFNQFHDLLPGSAIRRAYDDAHRLYDQAEKLIIDALDNALETLANRAGYAESGYPLVVFNSLGFRRTDLAQIILDFIRENQDKAFYSTEIAEALGLPQEEEDVATGAGVSSRPGFQMSTLRFSREEV
jgi:alpha-mannosidase